MRGQLLCMPCTVRTALSVAQRATDDEDLQKEIMIKTMKWLVENSDASRINPVNFHTYVFRLVQRTTGNLDPFRTLKKTSSEIAMRVLPILEGEFRRRDSKEAFKLAAMGAICGNTIDFEVESHHISLENLENSLGQCLMDNLDIDDIDKLMEALSYSKSVLYLLDNAGEIVFDRFFIKVITETYPTRVCAVVKAGPILNDATLEEAKQVKLEEVAEVTTTGNDCIGLNLEESSEEFLRNLRNADLIVAKGQGYYESILDIECSLRKPIAYILRAKCPLVAQSLGVRQYGNVIKVVN